MAGKSNGLDASEWARHPPAGNVYQRILKAIYDPEEKSFCGRTAKRWGIVLMFYAVFYAVLALLFAICMGGLFYTIDRSKPTYILEKSLIGNNPGVAYRPLPIDYVAFKYKVDNSSEYEPYVTSIGEFLESYTSQNLYTSATECNAGDNYGYPLTPCFFIKLNKIYDWQPEYYDANELPSDMPQDLIDNITALEPKQQKQVWISCFVEADNTTTIEYPWGRGLPSKFYPYRNQEGYISPLIAIKVNTPVNTSTYIRCRAWAKNIIYNRSIKEASGYTRIQLHIEDSAGTDNSDVTQ